MSNPPPETRNRWLGGPWPVVVLLVCYLALGLSAVRRTSPTFDEGLHLTGGASYWITGDYRLQTENGNWSQRWAALPAWLQGATFPSTDQPNWKTPRRWQMSDLLLYGSGNDADSMMWRGRVMIAAGRKDLSCGRGMV